MKPAPLLFDMDGLLLDTERLAMQSFCELACDLGLALAVAETEFLTLIGSSGAHTRARLHHILPSGADIAGFDQDWSARFRDLISRGVPLRPHARETVHVLAGRGHEMAVVTSTSGGHARDQLQQAGLLGCFVAVVGGDEVSANKPDPAPYLAGAAALGADPAHCFAFEDSDKGVTSAHAAGCKVVQIPDLRPHNVALPDLGQLVAADLNEAVRMTGLLPSSM